MVDNQHKKIAGYRDLSEDEIGAMNRLKDLEREVLGAIDNALAFIVGANPRSMAIAKTELQTGFMWAIRAIARPNGE